MKIKINNYTFNAASRQITFVDYDSIRLDSVLLVTNVTDNLIIYNFADPVVGGAVSGNVLTLDYNTTTMDNTDSLQIFYDDSAASQSVSLDDLCVTLRNILHEISDPSHVDLVLNRLRTTALVESGTITTVSTVTTVGNQTLMDSHQAKLIPMGMDELVYADLVLRRIS